MHDTTERRLGPRFDLARPSDDAELRALLKETPMRGRIELAFLREPSYLRAAQIAGPYVQVLVARVDGRIVGVATRALRPTYINGQQVTAGYLSDLRLRPEYQNGTLLARGYRFLRELHRDGRADVYSTVIVEDNRAALRTIAANRADLPRYVDRGKILTPMIHLRRTLQDLGGEIERGSRASLPEIVRKLNENRLQFAPVWSEADFLGHRFPGFRIEDFYVLRRRGRIAGVMGIWDQRAFRQTAVVAYHGSLRWLRPLVNKLRRSPLPDPGKALAYFFVSFVATDDVDAFRVLLRRVYNAAVGRDLKQGGFSHFIAGVHERDPRADVFEEYSRTSFAGRLFSVTFDAPPELDGRVPYMEAALL